MASSSPAAAGPRPAAAGPHKYAVEEKNAALLGAVGRPRTVLDVGCGVGLNGAALKGRGARVTGIESAESAVSRARQVLDEVVVADITKPAQVTQALGDRVFDAILFADVLEHMANPEQVLESFLPYLEDGGHVIVSLPNVAAWTMRLHLLSGRFEYDDSGILDDSHLRFFTLRSAKDLLQSVGLEVLWTDLNPLLLRAAKSTIKRALLPADGGAPVDPEYLQSTATYKLYQELLRPLEHRVARTAPELLAFQHVIVARKPPERRKLSLTVGMLSMDEEESVARMIGEIRKVAPDAQILCVDSSTRDRTPEIARGLGARVLRQIPPRGHGPAMELLMYSAAQQSELLIYLDCDFTYPPSYIPVVRRIIEEEGMDVVNCARTRHKPTAMPLPNFIANRTFAAMAHGMHGIPTCDVHSGMRAYRTSVIQALDFDGEGDALPIDTLLFPAKCGYRVVEMPISYDERVGVSKLRKIAGTVWTLIRLVRALPVGSRHGTRFDTR